MERIDFDRNANKEKRLTFSVALQASTDALKLRGRFVVYNRLSTDRGGYLALIPPDSMQLPSYDIVALYNHDDSHILARESNSSLSILKDAQGIVAEMTLADTQFNRDLVAQVNRGDINGMSFGMFPLKTRAEQRVLTAADIDPNTGLDNLIGKTVNVEIYDSWLLDEITVTGLAAFPQTTVESFSKIDKGIEGEELEVYISQLNLVELELE